MKLTLPYLLVAVNLALGSAAYAESTSPSYDGDSSDAATVASSVLPDYQNGHAYVGGRIGWAAYQDACGSSAEYCDTDTLGLGVYGGYQFTDWFALEGGMTSYGSPEARYATGGKVEADVYGGELAVKLSVPITERMALFTRLGGAWQRIDKTVSRMPDSIESSEWNVLSSLGVSYRISQRWSLRGEYQFIDGIGDGEVDQADQHFTSVGLTYHFGQAAPVIIDEAPVIEPEPQTVTTTQMVSLSAESLFGFDSSELTYNADLESLAEQLTQYSEDKVQIVGHTDSTGPEAYNQRLSERRAQAVADYLKRMGIAESRLSVEGQGESHPVASNDTAEGRVQNRRVEVVFDTTVEETQSVTTPSGEEE
ncbi:OmpA family protein [Vibrio parahaemolyticus]|uniref:OmpA family protein n=1 Tax=Vibrio parahaemolyticus TaxID=670 RepID=UPI001E64CA1E|nr:OmpA family protein [Vibrio parahaemolyticus]